MATSHAATHTDARTTAAPETALPRTEHPTVCVPIAAEEHVRTVRRLRYADTYARLAAVNRYLRFALLAMTLVAIGLIATHVRTVSLIHHLKPLVVRIDDVGRAQAVQYDASTYTPREPELRHFLAQFVAFHFGRVRATVRRDFSASLMFLDAQLADATVAADRERQTIDKFLGSSDPEIEIDVKNVALQEIRTPPYRATVDYERVYVQPSMRRELKRVRCVATFQFVVTEVPTSFIPVNPLGLVITYFREDQAFTEGAS